MVRPSCQLRARTLIFFTSPKKYFPMRHHITFTPQQLIPTKLPHDVDEPSYTPITVHDIVWHDTVRDKELSGHLMIGQGQPPLLARIYKVENNK